MLNRITSAGTAAQKSSKSSLFARLPLLLAIPMLCAVFSVSAQKKTNKRYYQATYFGVDSLNNTQYGTFFFVLGNNTFPTKEETKTLIIVAYKLNFSPLDGKLVVSLTEFKNEKEFYMWNRK